MFNTKGKWLYFCLFAWFASQGRFTAIFLEERKLDEREIGTLLSLKSIIGIIVTPVAAYFADNLVAKGVSSGREIVVVVLSLLTTITFLCHGIPELFHNEGSFAYFMLIRVIYSAFSSPIYSIISGIVLKNLADNDICKEAFGQERLFGALSWAITNMLLGVAMDYRYSSQMMYIFMIATQIILLFCICCVTKTQPVLDFQEKGHKVFNSISQDIPCDVIEAVDCEEPLPAESKLTVRSSQSVCSGVEEVWQLLCVFFSSSDRAVFTLLCVILSMGTSIVESLVFLFFRDKLGSSNTVCGLSVVVTVIFEIPIFQYSEWMLSVFGRNGLVVIACLAYVCRVIGYTFAPNGWWVLLLEPLHGVTFGCICTASVDFAASIAPEGLESTAQAVMSSLQGGLGSLVGITAGAIVEEAYGSHVLYRGSAIVIAVNLLCFVLLTWRCGCGSGYRNGAGSDGKKFVEMKYEKVSEQDV